MNTDAIVEGARQIQIREGQLEDVLQIYPEIPEMQNPHGLDEYRKRLLAAPRYLLLVAYDEEKPVGFKCGYERDSDGSFYSWMGGVAQSYRRYGIARQLAQTMESWAKEKGYASIRFKTRNSLKPMLLFALSNGFDIVKIDPKEQVADYRITLEKQL